MNSSINTQELENLLEIESRLSKQRKETLRKETVFHNYDEIINNEDQIEDKKQLKDMAPLYMIFSSSFNAEMVYIILKSVISFSKIYLGEDGYYRSTSGRITISEKTSEQDTVIKINSMQVKDAQRWNTRVSYDQSSPSSYLRASEESQSR